MFVLLRTRPPTCERASNTVTVKPCWPSRRAAIKPAKPPPTTATRSGFRWFCLFTWSWHVCENDNDNCGWGVTPMFISYSRIYILALFPLTESATSSLNECEDP